MGNRAMNQVCKANRRRSARTCAGLSLTCLALGLTAAAPAAGAEAGKTVRVQAAVAELPGPAGLIAEEGAIRLTLEEAAAMALERNLGLYVERYNVAESGHVVTQNEGIFDLNLSALVSTFDETSPAASNLTGADIQQQEGQSWNLGLDQLLSAGGVLSVDFNNSRFETNSVFATINPSFRVDLDATLTQPLLRDFGKQATERGIRIARTNVGIGEENFELRVTITLNAVEQAYWDLVEAQDQLQVAEESLALARKLHEQNRIRVEVGTLAPLELVQSEAGIATREEALIRARALVGDRGDVLRQLLNLERGEVWETPVAAVTAPEMDPIEVRLEETIATALAERPELRAKRLSQEILEGDVAYFRNQLKPRLDLNAAYGFNGLGGDVTAREFPSGDILFQLPGDYGDALDQITDADFEGWSVGLTFAYPLQNRTARAQSAIAQVAYDRGETELKDLELQVTTEVRRLSRALEAAAESIESSRVSVHLAEKNLDAEQKRYENGMSTSFQVLEIQEDLSQARSRLVSSVTAYRRFLAQYYAATGRLTEETGVEIVDASAPSS